MAKAGDTLYVWMLSPNVIKTKTYTDSRPLRTLEPFYSDSDTFLKQRLTVVFFFHQWINRHFSVENLCELDDVYWAE